MKTEFTKPVLILLKFCQFSAHSSSTKNCEIINVKWFKRKPTGNDFSFVFWSVEQTFFYSFAAVYGAEFLFSSNDKSSLVTWQMLFIVHTYFGKHVELSWFPVLLKSIVWVPSFPRWWCFYWVILRSSSVFLWSSNSPFKLNFEIKVS